jgi:hypothetical protein
MRRQQQTFFGGPGPRKSPFLQVLNTGRLEDEREKGETFALMARANGRGRLIPTPALSKIMLHRAAGGLGGPLLKTVHCIYIMNPQQPQSQSHLRCSAVLGVRGALQGAVYGSIEPVLWF